MQRSTATQPATPTRPPARGRSINNTTGVANTATGLNALLSNTTGDDNTATGVRRSHNTPAHNTATGFNALLSNTTGDRNTATGQAALRNNTTGTDNTATGSSALRVNTTGINNTAIGHRALDNNPTGSSNIALGYFAGTNLTTGDNNIDIGNRGVAAESNTIRIGTEGTQTNAYIAGIYSTPVAKGLVVKVDSTGHLGTVGSSGRFKEQIKPMGNASEAILALKPVTFRYKKEIDPERTPEFGLVAEDVEKVNPDLVARDARGKPYTVRYEAVNAMLLNEFLKEHRQVQEQEATIAQLKSTVAKQEAINAQQQREIEALAATLREQASQIQKVSARLEMQTAPAQTVANSQVNPHHNEHKKTRSVRLFRFARFDHFASLRSHIFDCRRDFAGFLPSRNAGGCFAKNTDVRRTRGLSTSHRGSLLASPDLAKGTPGSQAITRCGDVSGAIGKQSRRLSAQLASTGGALATADNS